MLCNIFLGILCGNSITLFTSDHIHSVLGKVVQLVLYHRILTLNVLFTLITYIYSRLITLYLVWLFETSICHRTNHLWLYLLNFYLGSTVHFYNRNLTLWFLLDLLFLKEKFVSIMIGTVVVNWRDRYTRWVWWILIWARILNKLIMGSCHILKIICFFKIVDCCLNSFALSLTSQL